MTKTSSPTKRGQIINLISRRGGANIGALCKATGWEPHSVRAAISGLRKTGYTVNRTAAKTKGQGAIYRLSARPSVA